MTEHDAFRLTAASPRCDWLVAADWVEDQGGDPVKAAAMRGGLAQPFLIVDGGGYGGGYGDGDGDGGGDGGGGGYGGGE